MKKNNKIWKFFTSIKLAVALFLIIAAVSIIGTLIPQQASEQEYIHRYGMDIYRLFSFLQFTCLYKSWWFLLLLSFLGLNILACTLARFSLKINRLGSTLTHLSILAIYIGAMIGAIWGQRGYMQVFEGKGSDIFYSGEKERKLDFQIYLEEFSVEYYPGDDCCPGEHITVLFKDKEISTLAVEIGREYKIEQTKDTIKVLRYVPDFVIDTNTKKVGTRSRRPNNPALQVEIREEGGKSSTKWIFAKYPDMHAAKSDLKLVYHWTPRQVKQYKSKLKVIEGGEEKLAKEIMVNVPLRYKGWTFYQSSYDMEEHKWSGLQVTKDPGVPVVYIGFLLLTIGLIMTFYLKPFLNKS